MELTQEQINDIADIVFSMMESQGMLPGSQLDVIAQNVKKRLKLDSTGVDEVPVVDSIDGVNSLPCIRQSGSVFDIVRAPLWLLKGKLASMPIFRISSGYWQISENYGITWRDVLDSTGKRVSALGSKGDPGDSVNLRTTDTEVQWKSGNGEWEILASKSDLGVSSISELEDVSNEADTAPLGSLFVKGEAWQPIAPVMTDKDDYDNMLMPVFHKEIGEWIFVKVSAISGGNIPIVEELILGIGVLDVNKLA